MVVIMNRMITRTYSELIQLKTFEERFDYLKLDGAVGFPTFGHDRYLNQKFYESYEWKRVRDIVIIRDNGCDLGVEGFEIQGSFVVHHMNPITVENFEMYYEEMLKPEFLISTTAITHKAIHYSDSDILPSGPITRRSNDTCPWRKE